VDIQEFYSANGVPLFNGSFFSHWSIRMRAFFQAQGFDIFQLVLDDYTTPKGRQKGAATKKAKKRQCNGIKHNSKGLIIV